MFTHPTLSRALAREARAEHLRRAARHQLIRAARRGASGSGSDPFGLRRVLRRRARLKARPAAPELRVVRS